MKQITKKLFTALLLVFSSSLLFSCGGDGIGGTGSPLIGVADVKTSITQLPVPLRERGYSNLEPLVIHSQTKLDTFISDVKRQDNWNNKDTFLHELQAHTFDFTEENFILYPFSEPSGAISLSAQTPIINNTEVTIKILRQVPTVSTLAYKASKDITHYLLAYRTGKDITKITFDNGTSQVEVDIPTAQGKLVRSDDTKLLTYFKNAIKEKAQGVNRGNQDGEVTFANATGDSSNSSSGISTTNIQEAGVDEADLIKTDGRYIFSVKKNSAIKQHTADLKEGIVAEGTEITSDSIRIMDTRDSSGIIEVKDLSDKNKPWSIAGLYLHDNSDKKQLIALSSEKQQYWAHWFDSYYFSNQKTDVLFIDVNDPAKASITNKLSFEGQLIDSRRNGDVLYLVLRHYPDYQYTDDQKLATTSNETFLPRYQVDTAKKQLISQPEDCYLEEGQKGSADIITLIAVDLSTASNPQISSQCYVGSAEAIYSSQNALYLATTRWNYQTSNGGDVEYKQQITTDIHKFSYDGLHFDYRGSGEVDGHLGYKQDSKSFRFSEHNELLRVVTFNEQMWGLTTVQPFTDSTAGDTTTSTTTASEKQEVTKSPVLISILKEDPNKKTLKLVSMLPNSQRINPIGLPGERLYATRFIGSRAYVVTFRVTDPLYVIDLSNPTDPKIAGELKIDGYSDYLHPISENLLLGIGKDAIPAQTENNGDGRGAWYQGVKLSLIDVTDPANPQEADKVILGKRGTNSTALYSHHAITGLKVNNDTYRVAIPINIHTEAPSYGSIQEPFAYYGYSHTGLYRFEVDINNQTIHKVPPMIVNDYLSTDSSQNNRDIYTDRSVLIKNDVFYMHQGNFWSQDWQGENAMTGPK